MAIKFLNTVAVDNDVLYVDAANNRVGIGTTNPGVKLDVIGVTKTDSILINAASPIASSIVTLNKASTSTGTDVGQFYDITKENTANSTTSVTYGVVNRVDSISAFENRGIITQNNIGRVTGTGDFSYVYPSYNQSSIKGTGTVDYAVASYNEASLNNAGGTVNNLWGTHTEVQLTAGTVGEISLLNFDFDQSAGTTITGDFQYINISNEQPVLNISGTARALNIESDLPSFFAGSIGIGTSSPNTKLHVDGGANSEVLKIEADANPYIRWTQNGTNVGFLQFSGTSAYLANMSNGSLFFRTNNTDKMVITSAGNVGIGTTSPTAPLHVIGTVRMGNTSEGLTFSAGSGIGNIIGVDTGFAGYNAIALKASANTGIYLDTADNVGIGTTSPSEKLEVDGNVQIGSTTDAKLYMVSTGGNGNNERFFIEGYADGGTYGGGFKLSTRNDSNIFNTAVTVNRNGNVGIGTTSPTHLLTLETASSPGLKIKDTTQGATLLAFSQDSNSHIGTYSSHPFVFDTNSTERMRITSSGNVGIGTTSPSQKLHVAGNMRLQNQLYDSTNSQGTNGDVLTKVSAGTEWKAPNAQMPGNTAPASAANVGTIRYNTTDTASSLEVSMQTSGTTYEWVSIVRSDFGVLTEDGDNIVSENNEYLITE